MLAVVVTSLVGCWVRWWITASPVEERLVLVCVVSGRRRWMMQMVVIVILSASIPLILRLVCRHPSLLVLYVMQISVVCVKLVDMRTWTVVGGCSLSVMVRRRVKCPVRWSVVDPYVAMAGTT